MRYLAVDDVIAFSEAEVGPNLLADFGRLDAAVYSPQQSFDGNDLYPDVATKAAVLVFSIIRAHAFIDGNKRVGIMALDAFLLKNGFELLCTDADLVGLALDIARGIFDVPDIIGFVKGHMSAAVPPGFDSDVQPDSDDWD